MPVTYEITRHKSTSQCEAIQCEAILAARKEMGWQAEPTAIYTATCSCAALGLHKEPMAAAVELRELQLVMLMLSPQRPELGRVVCVLDPLASPPTLIGGDDEWMTSSAAPIIQATLQPQASLPAQASPTSDSCRTVSPAPAIAACAAHSAAASTSGTSGVEIGSAEAHFLMDEANHIRLAGEKGEQPPPRQPPLASAVKLPQCGLAEGQRFRGQLHHPMFGDMAATLSLNTLLDQEPPESIRARDGIAWPPPPPEDEDSAAAQGISPSPDAMQMSISWFSGLWKVAEMREENEVVIGFHSSGAIIIVTPARKRQIEFGQLDWLTASISGGDERWQVMKPAQYSLKLAS
eukprot:CAMPEP_0119346964 /NCGR_PEP_ID=MMETSP1333-20130426/108275_1 /TAXON_ID=418940 /ORGANISM="Scyphosphaera apsteinii, Strain RCC1455" /LENGTH=348 /DNA_ID=CAMNT_0007359491 /DNA_START=242 /DNA_END=1288 /DNA_ORIENTATION=+